MYSQISQIVLTYWTYISVYNNFILRQNTIYSYLLINTIYSYLLINTCTYDTLQSIHSNITCKILGLFQYKICYFNENQVKKVLKIQIFPWTTARRRSLTKYFLKISTLIDNVYSGWWIRENPPKLFMYSKFRDT